MSRPEGSAAAHPVGLPADAVPQFAVHVTPARQPFVAFHHTLSLQELAVLLAFVLEATARAAPTNCCADCSRLVDVMAGCSAVLRRTLTGEVTH